MKPELLEDKTNGANLKTEQSLYSRREIVFTMIGALMVMFLAMMDSTVVGTAMPHIIADLHGFDQLTWITTVYLLTSTVTIPIYGKLSDLLGRKPLFLFGIVVFLVGSALSGAAQSMNELITFRALQGLGAGALEPIALTVTGDLFPPRERGKWQGVGGSIYGLAAIVGPLVGGWITDHASWRWVFYVNLPVGVGAFFVLLFLMPRLRGMTKNIFIDYAGAVFLILGTVPVLLGFSLAGTQYAWLSPQIIGLFALAIVVLAILVVYEARVEKRGKEPVFEPSLFVRSPRIYGVSMLVTVIVGIGLYACVFFIPLFVQGVVGSTATNSGLVLTPFMITAILGSVISGLLMTLFGKYKWIAVLTLVISVIGTLLLVQLNVHSDNTQVLIAMIVLGFGIGPGIGVYTTIVQNALPKKMGLATATLTFFRQLGGTIGLAAIGSIVTSSYVSTFHNALPPQVKQQLPARAIGIFDNPQILLSPGTLAQIRAGFAAYGPHGKALFNVVVEAMKTGLAQSLHYGFIAGMGMMIAALIVVFFLKEIPLRRKHGASEI